MRKGGIKLLRKALGLDTHKDELLIEFLKSTFNISDFNVFFRDQFQVYLRQPDVLLKTEKS
jgi:hypothetical protein